MNKLKITILAIALAGVSNFAMAQAEFAVGLKGGLNFSKFDASAGLSNVENRTGYHGGAFALIKIANIGIQPEIIFSKQGSDYKVNTTNYEANFDYINVPIMLKLYLVAGLNLQAGPQFGFLTASELKSTAANTTISNSKDLFKRKNDTSIAVGAGWDLPFGLTLDARYNIGLSDIKYKDQNGTTDVNFKNKVLQLSVGYKLFKFGK